MLDDDGIFGGRDESETQQLHDKSEEDDKWDDTTWLRHHFNKNSIILRRKADAEPNKTSAATCPLQKGTNKMK
jgi:hypothetical protein